MAPPRARGYAGDRAHRAKPNNCRGSATTPERLTCSWIASRLSSTPHRSSCQRRSALDDKTLAASRLPSVGGPTVLFAAWQPLAAIVIARALSAPAGCMGS